MVKKPPLVITEDQDWAQYRMWIIESIRYLMEKQDEMDKRLQSLAIKVAGITALTSLVFTVLGQILAHYFTGKK